MTGPRHISHVTSVAPSDCEAEQLRWPYPSQQVTTDDPKTTAWCFHPRTRETSSVPRPGGGTQITLPFFAGVLLHYRCELHSENVPGDWCQKPSGTFIKIIKPFAKIQNLKSRSSPPVCSLEHGGCVWAPWNLNLSRS